MSKQLTKACIDVVKLETEWEKCKNQIVDLQHIFAVFKIDFLDRNSFSEFCNPHILLSELLTYKQIFITGYFSETIRETLESVIILGQAKKVRLISQFLTDSMRDRKNLEVLRKLAQAGAEIKFNNRLHARFLVASNPPIKSGLLLIGSFDFNTECIGKERFDAGIKTKHPDLVESATKLFEQIWNEPESVSITDYAKRKS
jgi:hypothetical protein